MSKTCFEIRVYNFIFKHKHGLVFTNYFIITRISFIMPQTSKPLQNQYLSPNETEYETARLIHKGKPMPPSRDL